MLLKNYILFITNKVFFRSELGMELQHSYFSLFLNSVKFCSAGPGNGGVVFLLILQWRASTMHMKSTMEKTAESHFFNFAVMALG